MLSLEDLFEKYVTKNLKPIKPKKVIRNMSFQREVVSLDEVGYENCTFEDVTFSHNGGPLHLKNNKIGACTLTSESRDIQMFVLTLHKFGFLKYPVHSKDKTIQIESTNSDNS